MRAVLFVLALLLVCTFATTPARAATYFVAPDGSGDYPTISAAVQASADGDVIDLGDGTFQGAGNRNIYYDGKEITIRSQSGDPSGCIIDCEGFGTFGFRFAFQNWRTSVLEGVTITGGHDDFGGGIQCEGGSPTIRNCIIRDCWGEEGGGLHVWGGEPLVQDCLFADNMATYGAGAAASVGFAETVVFERCTFIRNQAETEGGGVRF